MTGRAFVALLLLVVAACSTVRIDRPNTTPPEDATTDPVRDFVRLMNRHRQSKGCPVLVWNDKLAEVAEKHSAEMARYQYMSHTNRAGKSPFQRMQAAGVTYRRAAENIAQGQRTGAEVLATWRNSSGHRQNIEDCGYTQHGVAMVNSYWTHVFITPR